MTNSESCAGIFIAIRSCPWREIRTSSRIAAFLTELGYEVKVGDEVSLPDKRCGVPDEETMEREYLRAVEQGGGYALCPRMKNGATGVIATLDCGDGPKASEDFAWICKTVRDAGGQSCYFNVVSTCHANVHQPTFDFEETALINSVKTFVLTVMDLLK